MRSEEPEPKGNNSQLHTDYSKGIEPNILGSTNSECHESIAAKDNLETTQFVDVGNACQPEDQHEIESFQVYFLENIYKN